MRCGETRSLPLYGRTLPLSIMLIFCTWTDDFSAFLIIHMHPICPQSHRNRHSHAIVAWGCICFVQKRWDSWDGFGKGNIMLLTNVRIDNVERSLLGFRCLRLAPQVFQLCATTESRANHAWRGHTWDHSGACARVQCCRKRLIYQKKIINFEFFTPGLSDKLWLKGGGFEGFWICDWEKRKKVQTDSMLCSWSSSCPPSLHWVRKLSSVHRSAIVGPVQGLPVEQEETEIGALHSCKCSLGEKNRRHRDWMHFLQHLCPTEGFVAPQLLGAEEPQARSNCGETRNGNSTAISASCWT